MKNKPELTAAVERSILEKAWRIRKAEERLLTLFSEGKLAGTVHTCIGQELVGAVISGHLRPGDAVFSTHRGHGHFLATRGNLDGFFAELLGRTTGVCGGRGGSQHLHEAGFYS